MKYFFSILFVGVFILVNAQSKMALTKEPKPNEWTEVEKISESKKDEKSQASIQ